MSENEEEFEVVYERDDEVVDGIHTIAVPEGWSVEQAWEAIAHGDGLPATGELRWANVEVKDGKYVKTYPADLPTDRVSDEDKLIAELEEQIRETPDEDE
jgi:hypothetical protein